MEIFTIGFTQTTAEDFFGRLRDAGVRVLMDVRLSNSSQLAGFAKAVDLSYFLRELVRAEYRHEPLLAPDEQLFADYRKHHLPWGDFERRFLTLMAERNVEQALTPEDFAEPTALLCSEATPEHCHRRLACEYLAGKWGKAGVEVRITHL